MSAEKVQYLLGKLDEIRVAADEVALELGFSSTQVLSPGMLRPMLASDWLLALANPEKRDPGVLRFMIGLMKEPPPGAVTRNPDHKGKTKAKGGPAKRVKSGTQAA